METKEKPALVRFVCPSGHVWRDPMPIKEAPVMANLFGKCPRCNKQGTAKEE